MHFVKMFRKMSKNLKIIESRGCLFDDPSLLSKCTNKVMSVSDFFENLTTKSNKRVVNEEKSTFHFNLELWDYKKPYISLPITSLQLLKKGLFKAIRNSCVMTPPIKNCILRVSEIMNT